MHHNHHHAAHPSAEHVARLSEHVHHPCGRPDHHGDGRAIADIRNIKPPKPNNYFTVKIDEPMGEERTASTAGQGTW